MMRRRFIGLPFGRRLEVLAEHDGTGLSANYIRLAVAGMAEGEIAEGIVSAQTLADPLMSPCPSREIPRVRACTATLCRRRLEISARHRFGITHWTRVPPFAAGPTVSCPPMMPAR
jgi:hypothetical protein